jgi:alpha-methylacyl-CoA racemase
MGPLNGLRILELAGIGPGPHAAMLLGDMGAEVVRIERPEAGDSLLPLEPRHDVVSRGRRSVTLDLKHPAHLAVLLRLIERADGLIEGFRPGVMERLGLGPDVCLARNPRLVFGRITGFGQTGTLAHSAGHDLNYLSLTGALGAMGRPGSPPAPPLNLIADYGGGAMLLAFGMVCALLERQRSGVGQVVDAAMVDGVAALSAMFFGLRASGLWSNERGSNLLDGGAPFYDTYETRDGRYVAVAALEAKFFAELAGRIGLEPRFITGQRDRSLWPELRARLQDIFRSRTRQEWTDLLEGSDCCVTGVLDFGEAPSHPHNAARGVFTEVEGTIQPAPAPRFSRSQAEPPRTRPGGLRAVLADWGVADAEIDETLAAVKA